MRKITIVTAFALLSMECHAQMGPAPGQTAPTSGQCEQVRAAVTQHGLQAARKHAMENYGLTLADLRRIEQDCGIGERSRRTNR